MMFRALEAANDDAFEIAQYLNRQSAELGNDFAAELESATRLIVENARLYSPTEDGPRNLETREYLIRRFNYRVIYAIMDDEIVLVAIAHTSRKPGRWNRRLAGLG